jgi:hypothetical protein
VQQELLEYCEMIEHKLIELQERIEKLESLLNGTVTVDYSQGPYTIATTDVSVPF